MNRYFTVDADSHVLEPPDLWERYLESRYKDRAIKIRPGPNGEELIVDGEVLMSGRLASLGGVEHNAGDLFRRPDVPYLAGCPPASMPSNSSGIVFPASPWV